MNHPAFLRRRDDQSEPFECPFPITCKFPNCICEPPKPDEDDRTQQLTQPTQDVAS